MKTIFLTLLGTVTILYANAQSQSDKEEQLRSAINVVFNKNVVECSKGVDAVCDFNGKAEFWNVCELKNGNRIITIESYKNNTYYQEVYFEQNGELIYAKDVQNYLPKNQFTQIAWNCEFYIKQGKIISEISLGHGKTERDDWNPNVIFKMYKKRLVELKRIKQ